MASCLRAVFTVVWLYLWIAALVEGQWLYALIFFVAPIALMRVRDPERDRGVLREPTMMSARMAAAVTVAAIVASCGMVDGPAGSTDPDEVADGIVEGHEAEMAMICLDAETHEQRVYRAFKRAWSDVVDKAGIYTEEFKHEVFAAVIERCP